MESQLAQAGFFVFLPSTGQRKGVQLGRLMTLPAPPLSPAFSQPDDETLRIHRPRRALPTDVVRPTRAEVNLAHLRHNLHVLRQVAGQTPLWAVLKADGYGHGAKAVARTLERAGVDGICVALIEEGVELREAGITVPILVMGGYAGNAFQELIHHQLTVVVHEMGQLEQLARALRYSEVTSLPVHIKVDTGMGRLGTRPAEWQAMASVLREHPALQFEGLMTHFANADLDQVDALDEPCRLFEQATQIFAQQGLHPRLRHAGNSSALLRGAAYYDLVRTGIALFGVNPIEHFAPRSAALPALPSCLRPVMSIVSQVVALRDLEPGDAAGYGSTWRASRPSRLATVPLGYADGYSRALSNRGHMLVHAQRAPIVGIVSMDMTMIDVTDIPGVRIGDEVVALGCQQPSARSPFASSSELAQVSITATEIAETSGTIAWEVLTNISRRVPRFYREP